MQPKNLGLKFAFLGLLVMLSVFAMWAVPLRLGVDLEGGHILTFEVQLGPKEGAEVVQDVIKVLKRRIDPTSLAGLEWRPVGGNRFAVRMPMGTAEAREAKETYLRALEQIEQGNVQRSQIRKVVASKGPERKDLIAKIAGADRARAELLEKVAAAHDGMDQTWRKLEELRRKGDATGQDLTQAQDRYDEAALAYDEVVNQAFEGNVQVEALRTIAGLYVSGAEAKSMPKDRLEARGKNYREQLDALRRRQTRRRKQIDAAVQAYEDWTEKRTGLDDPADLKRLIARAGVLEFRVAATLPGAKRGTELTSIQHQRLLDQLATEGPLAGRSRNEPYLWFPVHGTGERFSPDLVIGKYAARKYVLLYNQPEFAMLQRDQEKTWELKSREALDNLNRPAVGFDLDARGAKIMGLLTSANKGRYMAILLDDDVYSAPVIRSAIYDKGIIEGEFTYKEVRELVQTLNAGALKARVNPNPVSEITIEPSIGRDNRESGIRAAIWGLIFVAGFMLVYYVAAGGIADVALLLNMVLVLGFMRFFFREASFTLAAMAGIVLTIGMAVDANVLIFERLREEQAKTRSIRMAIRNAYANAARAILDGNATTLITCIVLIVIGTEEVRGFAITLGLGVTFSLFTALVVTRWIFQLLAETGLIKDRVRMLAFIGTPNIDWMGKRRIFWTLSALLVAAGIAALSAQGKNVLGLEFSSGTQAVFSFKSGWMIRRADGQEVLPDRPVVENAVRQTAADLAAQAPPGQRNEDLTRIAETAKVETLVNRRKVGETLERLDGNGDGTIDRAEWSAGKASAAFFARMDANGDGKVTRPELEKNLPERSYQFATTVADVNLLREVVRASFGRELEMSSSIEFQLQNSGQVPELRVEIDPAGGGKTHVSTELADKVPPRMRGRFIDMVGGAMLIIRRVDPPMEESELADRIRTMRTQPDFEEFGFNKTTVIGLEADPAGGGYKSFATLVLNPNINYHTNRPEWKKFADNELKLLTAAMGREKSIESLLGFDAAIAGETAWRAGAAFVLSWVFIILYVWLRFGSARWGLAAVVCLVHDVLIAIGMVALSAYIAASPVGKWVLIDLPFKIDMAVVAAFLTIIGYSVNDTIVVFDRIRENRGKLATVDEATINRSINQTISRTLLTTFTTFVAVMTMYVAGGSGIRPFSYALLVGIIFGTYSSIAIASPLLLGFKRALVGRALRTAPARK